jgi:dTDP-glucose pyrophosphorylase
VRAYPYTTAVPKSMLEVDGVPLLQRNIELLRDQLDIREVRIVIGHHGHVIRQRFGSGQGLGVRLTYLENDHLDLELAYSVYLGTRDLGRPCCIVLADECYVGTNHRALLARPDDGALAVCGLIVADFARHVRKNYTVTLRDGWIADLVEKPARVTSLLMGTGTYLLTPALQARLREAFEPDVTAGPRDWMGWLAEQCRAGTPIAAFQLTGRYVNVNSRDDLNYANHLVRELTVDRRTVSLVYLVRDEDLDGAERPIEAFAARPEVDEVIAVAHRTGPALERLAALPKIRVVVTPTPSMPIGESFRVGLDASRGDMLLLSYSDDTFSPLDIQKLLVYLRDADLVVGTRTTRQMMEQGTNMRGTVRFAHLTLAKLMELLWWRFECRFTDVCCVYRGIWRSTWEMIRPNLTAPGVEFIPEMVIEVLRARRRIVEIPVNYCNRDLEYDYVRASHQNLATYARIVGLMLKKRFDGSAA